MVHGNCHCQCLEVTSVMDLALTTLSAGGLDKRVVRCRVDLDSDCVFGILQFFELRTQPLRSGTERVAKLIPSIQNTGCVRKAGIHTGLV